MFRGAYYRSIPDATRRLAAAAPEEILEPLLPIVDPHHHLVDGTRGSYLLDAYLADANGGHNVLASVFVESATHYRETGAEALRPVGEIEFVAALQQAGASGRSIKVCEGIVGHASLSAEGVVAVLEAEITAGNGLLKGVRDLVQWDGSEAGSYSTRRAPAHKLLDPDFRRGVASLASRDLSLDVWVFHPQLGEFADLLDAFPATQFVLDHAGTPLGVGPYAAHRPEIFAAWRTSMAAISQRDNVAVKIGGFGMPYTGFDFHLSDAVPRSAELAGAWSPYVQTCIELFGPSRCMFESNFPADKQTCSYTTLWNAFKRIVARYSAHEKSALFHETAQRIYRLHGDVPRPAAHGQGA
jgi:L-fuconolactonase